jgi:hypothetical protein
MENTYAGYGDESADVLCTIALGLGVVKRKESAAEDGVEDEGRTELDRTLLVKPKVILESVHELL